MARGAKRTGSGEGTDAKRPKPGTDSEAGDAVANDFEAQRVAVVAENARREAARVADANARRAGDLEDDMDDVLLREEIQAQRAAEAAAAALREIGEAEAKSENDAQFDAEDKEAEAKKELAEFFGACSQETPEEALEMLEGHPAELPRGWVHDKTYNDWTAMFLASLSHHVVVMTRLLDGGAEVDTTDDAGFTPLIIASQQGVLNVALILLDRGADPNRTSHTGCRALYMASQNGHLACVKLLLERGANLDEVGTQGCTSLYIACREGHLDIAKVLLDKGAAMSAANVMGSTPVWIACRQGHIDVATELFFRGATIGNIEHDAPEDLGSITLVYIRATEAARTRTAESHAAIVAAKDKAKATSDAAKDAASSVILGRTWALVSPLPDTTESDKPTVAAFVADPEYVIAPFEGHPSRQRGWIEREIDRGMKGDSSDGE